MEVKKLTKELAERLMKIEGETRGMNLKVDWEFILQKEGKEGLRKLEAKMTELGYPIKYKDIRSMDFYPIGMEAISILAIKEVFNYDEKKLEEMGASVVKFSLITKIFMKYFGSLRMIAKEIPRMWRKYYTIGDFRVTKIDEEKRYLILRLKNFHVHPVLCVTFRGYFAKVLAMMTKSPVASKETKCTFRGDKYHEYLLKW